LNLSIDANGKVGYSTIQGVTPNADATKLTKAIDDHTVTVNVNATNNHSMGPNLFVGGAFEGNQVTPSSTPGALPNVTANQEINPNVLAKSDEPYGKPGANTLHEVTEAYEGAKISQASGVSSPMAGMPGSVYSAAHAAATPQAGNVSETIYDSRGNVITPGPLVIPARVEFWVQPQGGSKSVILSLP
jgi:hypothetical protein